MMQGVNIKKLIYLERANLLVQGMSKIAVRKAADSWVKSTIGILKNAADPNPFKVMTDDQVAAYLVRHIGGEELLGKIGPQAMEA